MINPVVLLNRIYKRAEGDYYDDKPVWQFSKDLLNVKYYLFGMDKETYHIKKLLLEQRIQEYQSEEHYCKHHYFML